MKNSFSYWKKLMQCTNLVFYKMKCNFHEVKNELALGPGRRLQPPNIRHQALCGASTFFKADDSSGAHSELLAQHSTPPDGLFVSRPQHVAGWKLCRLVKTPGSRLSSLLAGLDALWHRGTRHAALASSASRRGTDDPRYQEAGFS